VTARVVIAACDLIALRPGARLRVELRGGREAEVVLRAKAEIVAAGRPGLGRVRLEVVDVEKLKQLEARFEARDRRAPRPGFEASSASLASHVVTGAQVIEVLP